MYPVVKKSPSSQQRQKNRRSKQNSATLPGGDLTSYKNQLHSNKTSDVVFSSLPPIHIGDAEPLVGVARGVFSGSCPLPSLNSPFKPPASSATSILPNPAKRKVFEPHWLEQAVEEAIEKGNAFRATFRVNAHNPKEAYCTIDGVPVDVLINGVDAQNRAIEGDMVAIMLDPMAYWTKLKGSSAPVNLVVSDDFNLSPECTEVDKNCVTWEQIDSSMSLQMGKVYNEKGRRESSLVYLDNGSQINYNRLDIHKNMALGSSNEALGKICAMLNFSPSKRPTGRVLAILRESPRRGAVIGFLSANKEHEMQENRQSLKKDNKILLSKYVQFLPTDPKFPKMVVSVSTLPDFLKEKLTSGDATLERELIAAKIDEWSVESPLPRASIIHILGRGGEIEPQIAAILFENALFDSKFSPVSLGCIPDLPWEVPAKEFKTRKDFRNICTFTIDPSSATDLDDALSVELVSDDTIRVGVHIADVSYFVLPGTALDKEAQIRSTSVYILQHRLSMLPPELSEGVCSLLPGVDRLAFSITWDINGSGKIVNRWMGRSIIQSCCKLSYNLVQEILDESFVPDQCNSYGTPRPQLRGCFEWKDIITSVRSLYKISMRLREGRFKDGALWLDSSKLGFLFDECGTPYDSFLCEMKESCLLVEEFMLLANRSVAEVISTTFPDCALLRRHPEPNLRKLREFEVFCNKHGFELDISSSGQLHLSLSRIREQLKDDPVLFDIILSYASRPMQPAAYFCTGELRGRENDWAHYALSVPFYTHFTSPIRRYPDIIVHRTLSAALDAEEEYLKKKQLWPYVDKDETSGTEVGIKCFTGLHFNKKAAESDEGRDALAAAVVKYKVPGCDVLSELALYCNERKVASRHAEDAGQKLYLWTLLKNKETLICEARVLGLGPKFMSVYIHKLAIERRIYYDEVESLVVEWLQTTSSLVLDVPRAKRFQQKVGNWKKLRPIDDVALVIHPPEESEAESERKKETSPSMFPLVLSLLSTVPVALHAIGGEYGPLEIGARLYMCSYFR